MLNGACLIGQSGGPTATINASLLGVIKECSNSKHISNIYGVYNGLEGVINEQIIEFDINATKLEGLLHTPGAILGTARLKLELEAIDQHQYQRVLKTFEKYNIRYFFLIGGNDSMDTCSKLNRYFENIGYQCQVIGIPKTIDNDLILTDHAPGYGSALKHLTVSLMEIYQDINSYHTGRVTIVEIMGRDAGWLTCSGKIAAHFGMGPDLIYIPEAPFDLDNFIEKVKSLYQLKRKVFVVVAEGLKDQNKRYILKYRHHNNYDVFGHLQLGGVAQVLAEIVNKAVGLPVRSIELNLPQRCASHIASLTDINESFECGRYGAEIALKGHSGQMVTMKRINTDQYQIKYNYEPLAIVANKVKYVPKSWIKDGNISEEYLNYSLPLIKGEVKIPYEDGVPCYVKIQDIIKKD